MHHEFRRGELPSLAATAADVVILAGDIHTGIRGVEWAVAECQRLGTPGVYVPGNHEYYGYSLPDTLGAMRAAAAGTPVSVLECDAVEIGGVRFLGSTLWSDFCLVGAERQAEAMAVAEGAINDYHQIRFGRTPLRATDTLRMHRKTMTWLEGRLAEPFDGPTVVVTHMGPSPRSCPPQYPLSPFGAAFLSDIESSMGAARVPLWVHGHTHWCVDYEVSGTRVVSNQGGYPDIEPVPGFDPAFTVEV